MPPLDIGAIAREIIDDDLRLAQQADVMMRAAVEAARADKGQGGALNPTTQPRGGRPRSSRWGAPNGATS
eukprot:4950877-Pleurochrysis_carterae.AAC.1